jgi:hypothetical protein
LLAIFIQGIEENGKVSGLLAPDEPVKIITELERESFLWAKVRRQSVIVGGGLRANGFRHSARFQIDERRATKEPAEYIEGPGIADRCVGDSLLRVGHDKAGIGEKFFVLPEARRELGIKAFLVEIPTVKQVDGLMYVRAE